MGFCFVFRSLPDATLGEFFGPLPETPASGLGLNVMPPLVQDFINVDLAMRAKYRERLLQSSDPEIRDWVRLSKKDFRDKPSNLPFSAEECNSAIRDAIRSSDDTLNLDLFFNGTVFPQSDLAQLHQMYSVISERFHGKSDELAPSLIQAVGSPAARLGAVYSMSELDTDDKQNLQSGVLPKQLTEWGLTASNSLCWDPLLGQSKQFIGGSTDQRGKHNRALIKAYNSNLVNQSCLKVILAFGKKSLQEFQELCSEMIGAPATLELGSTRVKVRCVIKDRELQSVVLICPTLKAISLAPRKTILRDLKRIFTFSAAVTNTPELCPVQLGALNTLDILHLYRRELVSCQPITAAECAPALKEYFRRVGIDTDQQLRELEESLGQSLVKTAAMIASLSYVGPRRNAFRVGKKHVMANAERPPPTVKSRISTRRH